MKRVILSIWLTINAAAFAGEKRFEPQVDAREVKLLANAQEVAATNLVAAAELVRSGIDKSSSAALDFALGNFMYQSGNLTAAADAYRAALQRLPDFRRARHNLALVYMRQDNPEAAVKTLRYLLLNGEADASGMLLLGRALAMQSEWVAAESAYRRALLLNTESDAARQGLVKALVEQERYKEARQLTETVLARAPRKAEFWNLLANINIALQDNQRAIVALETARSLGVATASMNVLMGDLYLDANQPEDAVAAYQRAIAAGYPDMDRLLRAVEGFVALGDEKKARRLLGKVEKSGQLVLSSIKYLEVKADLAVLAKQRDTAIGLYRKILRKEPLNGAVLLKLGSQLEAAGDDSGAGLCYERAAHIKGVESDALVRRAQLDVRAENYKRAIRQLEKAQAIAPREDVARYLRQLRQIAENTTQ